VPIGRTPNNPRPIGIAESGFVRLHKRYDPMGTAFAHVVIDRDCLFTIRVPAIEGGAIVFGR
jgi:hypothetical protein